MTSAPPAPPSGRPMELYLGAALLTVAALPLIMIGGMVAFVVGPRGAAIRQHVIDSVSGDPGALVALLRVGGAALLVAGLVQVALAWLVLRPRRRARTGVTALAAAEVALLVLGVVVTAPDPVSIGLTMVTGAGVALLYLPRSEEFLLGGH